MVQKIRGTRQVQAGTIGPTEIAATAVVAGEYGDASNVPVITVDADGRVTAASEVAVSGGGGVSDGDKGDITVSGTGAVWTVDNNVVTNAKAADMATDTIKGRATAATGDPEDLTALPFAFTGDVTRAVDSNAQVLAAGSASVLNSGTLPAGRMPALTGDVTTSAGAVAATIANDAVTYAKMQNVSAASRLLGRGSASGSGDVQEMTVGAGLSISGTELASTGGALVLDVNLTEVGNVGAGEDNLITYSVAGNTLAVNEEYLHFIASGIFAASINNKRLRAYLGTTLLFDSGALAITAATDWILEGWIVREGQSIQKCAAKLNTSSATLAAYVDYVGATEDLSTTLTLKLTGEATANNDIVQETLAVEKGGGAAGGSSVGGAGAHATMWHDEATVTAGNALAPTADGSQRFGLFSFQNTPANGDTFEQAFGIAAGTYTLSVLGITGNEKAIIDWYIDGVLVVTGQDWYSISTPVYNVVKTAGGIVISAGAHVLKGVINSKNGSSTDYQMLLTKYWFK